MKCLTSLTNDHVMADLDMQQPVIWVYVVQFTNAWRDTMTQ